MMRADDIAGRLSRRGRKGRAGAMLSMLLLIALPVILILGFFGWNLMLLSQQKTAQEITADACALAGGQSMVDNKALTGTNISALEDMALAVAKQYDIYNPLWPGVAPSDHLNIVASDLAFTTVDVAIGPDPDTLTLIDTMTLTGRRTTAHGNPVPILGGGLFASPTVDINVVSKVALDRKVAGLRPVYGKTIVLAPIAILQTTWADAVEKKLPLADITIEIGSGDTSFLNIGTADESEFAYQLSAVGGVTPSNLAGLGGQFFLDIVKGLDVGVMGGITPSNLKPAFDTLLADGHARIWPLFSTTDGVNTTVVRLVSAKVVAVDDTSGLKITLRPSFLSAPAVLTDTARDVNPYLCRVHLTN